MKKMNQTSEQRKTAKYASTRKHRLSALLGILLLVALFVTVGWYHEAKADETGETAGQEITAETTTEEENADSVTTETTVPDVTEVTTESSTGTEKEKSGLSDESTEKEEESDAEENEDTDPALSKESVNEEETDETALGDGDGWIHVSDGETLDKKIQALNNNNTGTEKTTVIVLDDNITVSLIKIVKANVTILGNHHTISKEGNYVFSVDQGGILNLGDLNNRSLSDLTIQGNESPDDLVYVDNQSTVNMYDGTVIKNNGNIDNGVSGGFSIRNDSCLHMFGGEISECKSMISGGVLLDIKSKFIMDDGSIHGCSSEGVSAYGGAVCLMNGSTFEMNGGSINNCSALFGGGICAIDATVNITGGSIEYNNASIGGGIMVDASSITISNKTKTILSHNKVTDNQLVIANGLSVGGIGGGIYESENSTVKVTDTPVLANNYAETAASDIYIESGSTANLPDASAMNQTYEAYGLTDQRTKGGLIDGWYYDDDPRYIPVQVSADTPKLVDDGSQVSEPISLVASYSKKSYTIKVKGEDVNVTYDGNDHIAAFQFSIDGGNHWSCDLPKEIPLDEKKIADMVLKITEKNAGDYKITLKKEDLENALSASPNLSVAFDLGEQHQQQAHLTIKKSKNLALDVEGYSGKYDGKPHGVSANPYLKDGAAGGSLDGTTIEYSTDGGKTWQKDSPTFVKPTSVKVLVRAKNPNFEDADGAVTPGVADSKTAEVVIQKRKITAITASATKVYDGKPLTNQDPITLEGDGFTEKDVVSYDFTGSQSEVGSSENTFRFVFDDPSAADNYDITYQFGTLTVTAAGGSDTRNTTGTTTGTTTEQSSSTSEVKAPDAAVSTVSNTTEKPADNGKAVRTGDETPIQVLVLVLIASAMGVAGAGMKKHNRK